MNFNNLPTDIHALIFQQNRRDAMEQSDKYNKWFVNLDEEEHDELADAIRDMKFRWGEWEDEEPPIDLSYIDDCVYFRDLKLQHRKYFYDLYWKAYEYNHNIMICGHPDA